MVPSYSNTPAIATDDVNPMQKFALSVWLVELVIYFSRFFDQIAAGYHVPALVLFVLIITSFMSGKILRGFSKKAGRRMALFVLWIMITLPFSIWRSNSIPTFGAVLISLLYFSVVSGLIETPAQIRQNMYALAFAILIAASLSFMFGAYRQDRFELEQGTYHDPNNYATCLMIGIPLWWFMVGSLKSGAAKIFAFLCTLPIFLAFFKTGSRGGLLGLTAVLILLFLQSSLPKKMILVAAMVLVVVLGGAVMPGYLKTRYLTSFMNESMAATDQSHADYLQADLNSAQSRKDILLKSISVTLANPIVGVGLSNFPVAVFAEARNGRRRYDWLVTHNTYTQISTETGIPGLLLFVTLLFYAFKNLSTVLKLTGTRSPTPRPDLWNAAKYLRLSLAGACVSIFFLSMGFTPEVYVLVGMTIALERVAQNEIARAVSAPSPIAVPDFTPRFPVRSATSKTPVRTPAPYRSGAGDFRRI